MTWDWFEPTTLLKSRQCHSVLKGRYPTFSINHKTIHNNRKEDTIWDVMGNGIVAKVCDLFTNIKVKD